MQCVCTYVCVRAWVVYVFVRMQCACTYVYTRASVRTCAVCLCMLCMFVCSCMCAVHAAHPEFTRLNGIGLLS
jgi:hypothetical protein